MNKFINGFKNAFLTPIKGFKKEYLPLLLIYFAYGAQGFTAVSMTFWEKDNLTLSTEQLLMVSVWVMMPWTMKVLVGPFVDNVKILGSNRKIYVLFGAILVALQFVILAGMGAKAPWIMDFGFSQYQLYLGAAILGSCGFMIQDVTADAMSTEVVKREGKTDEEIKAELGLVQVLGRLSLYIALMVVAGISGIVADKYEFSQVMWMSLWIPIFSVVGALFVKLEPMKKLEKIKIDHLVWGGAVVYVGFSLWMAFSEIKYGQELSFVVSFIILGSLLWRILRKLSPSKINLILSTLFVIFVYRAMPSTGPGFSWFAIDELGFDPLFFGVLKQTGSIIGVVALWLMADWMVTQSVKKIFTVLVVLGTILMIPDLILYYGIHEQLGLSPRFVALADTALESPLANLSMIPMLALIAYYAPAQSRATWFAVAASMMNLSLTASALGTKYLNQLFVVSREIKNEAGEITTVADYSNLGDLMIIVAVIGFVLPLTVIWLFLKDRK